MPPLLPLALLLAALAGPPPPLAREYLEEVKVTTRGLAEAREGVLQVRVVDGEGRFVPGLAATSFRLNRGEIEVVAAAEVRLQPAVQVVVDLTAGTWRPQRGRPPQDVRAVAREVTAALAREWPEGATAIALLDPRGVQRWRLDGLPGEPTWAENRGLAAALAASPGDPFARPLAPLETLFDKRLHERLGEVLPALGGWRLAGHQHLVVLVSDGWSGSPLAGYAISRNSDDCMLWPRQDRVAAEGRLQRALLADRAHPILVQAPPREEAALDLFSLGRCGGEPLWTRAPVTDASRLAELFRTMDGAVVNAQSLPPAEAAARTADEVRSRLDFYWLAWRTPPRAARGETFVKVDVVGAAEGVRAVPDRVGEAALLRQDPFLAPYAGPLAELPARFRDRLRPPG